MMNDGGLGGKGAENARWSCFSLVVVGGAWALPNFDFYPRLENNLPQERGMDHAPQCIHPASHACLGNRGQL